MARTAGAFPRGDAADAGCRRDEDIVRCRARLRRQKEVGRSWTNRQRLAWRMGGGGASAAADNDHQFASAPAIVDTTDRDASGLQGPAGDDRRAVVRFKCSRRVGRTRSCAQLTSTRFVPGATWMRARRDMAPSAADTLSRTCTDVSHLSLVTSHSMKPRWRLTNLSEALAPITA
jgi:hypothetical protein